MSPKKTINTIATTRRKTLNTRHGLIHNDIALKAKTIPKSIYLIKSEINSAVKRRTSFKLED